MSDVVAVVAGLRAAYPRAEFPEESQRAYVRQLADLDGEGLRAAANRLVNRSAFLPSIAEIREEVAEARLGLPSAAEAWAIAERGSLRDAPEEVRAAAESVGGRGSILRSENPETLRSQFIRDYEQRRRKALLVEMDAAPVAQWAIEPASFREILAGIPETDRILPRPVLLRAMARRAGRDLSSPSEEEKRDAILVLADGGPADLLYEEAERIFCEASV